jgi:hypothetical protein
VNTADWYTRKQGAHDYARVAELERRISKLTEEDARKRPELALRRADRWARSMSAAELDVHAYALLRVLGPDRTKPIIGRLAREEAAT